MEDNPLRRSEQIMDLEMGRSVVLKNGRILNPKDGSLRPGSVLIEDGIIRRVNVGDDGGALGSDEAEFLPLDGQIVMPGLIDLHVHNTGRDRSRPFQDYLPMNDGLKLFRAAAGLTRTLEAGYTTVRSLGHGPAEVVEQLKAAIKEGLIHGPRIISCGWAISQTGGHGNLRGWPYEWVERWLPRSGFADGVEGCRQMVRRNFGLGADVIKIYVSEGLIYDRRMDVPNFTLEEVRAITDEAHRRGKRVAAHVFGDANVRLAIEGNVDTIEHGVDASQATLEEMARRGVVLVPTLSVFHRYEARAGWNRPERPLTERQLELVATAQATGVKIGAGSDSGTYIAGQNAEELEHLVKAGLSPQMALAAATTVAAEALGMAERVGEVREGFVADLLVLEENPLNDVGSLRRPGTVWKVLRSRVDLDG